MPVITSKKYEPQPFSKIFSKELQEISSPSEKYSSFITDNEKTKPEYHQAINYKDITFVGNIRNKVKVAEVTYFI